VILCCITPIVAHNYHTRSREKFHLLKTTKWYGETRQQCLSFAKYATQRYVCGAANSRFCYLNLIQQSTPHDPFTYPLRTHFMHKHTSNFLTLRVAQQKRSQHPHSSHVCYITVNNNKRSHASSNDSIFFYSDTRPS